MIFRVRMGHSWGDEGFKTVLVSVHLVKELFFSIIHLILTFEFDLILGSFFTFWGPNELFLGLE